MCIRDRAGSIRVHIPIPGMHMVYNALAGTAVGLTLGLTLEEIKAGIEALQPTGGRNHIVHMGTYTVIDDCYNANPVSMGCLLYTSFSNCHAFDSLQSATRGSFF